MKCPNCGREESWEDASFCPRCGKQLISIITNLTTKDDNYEREKIELQIYQIGLWVFLTVAALLYVSKTVEGTSPVMTLLVFGCSALIGGFVMYLCELTILKK